MKVVDLQIGLFYFFVQHAIRVKAVSFKLTEMTKYYQEIMSLCLLPRGLT